MFDIEKIQDLDFTHKEFKKFIQRMNRRYEDFIYLATFSRQENGTWHYHMITNMIMDESVNNIQNIWGNGSCECKNMNSGDYYTNVKRCIVKCNRTFS
jgi:wyosine [tRNA(Phe)-imidazoG37] synthetase (radical SAM superfamily)